MVSTDFSFLVLTLKFINPFLYSGMGMACQLGVHIDLVLT